MNKNEILEAEQFTEAIEKVLPTGCEMTDKEREEITGMFEAAIEKGHVNIGGKICDHLRLEYKYNKARFNKAAYALADCV